MGEKSIYVDSKSSSGTVKSRIEVSGDLRKYFRCLDFYSSYDAEIVPSEGVLNIPILSIVLPLAWITGADVYVDELDEGFAKSMDTLQLVYQRTYPKAPFKTSIIVNDLVKGEDIPNDTALLFSGGVDSTYSLYSNITLNPRLVAHAPHYFAFFAEYCVFLTLVGIEMEFFPSTSRQKASFP